MGIFIIICKCLKLIDSPFQESQFNGLLSNGRDEHVSWTNPSSCVTQMEHSFSLHEINNEIQKIKVRVLYLGYERWKW